jgi:hypothetical protein
VLRYILLSLVLLLTGCSHLPTYIYTHAPVYAGPHRDIAVYIDKDFTEDDMLKIGAALDDWNYALNNYIVFHVVSTKFDMEPETLKRIISSNGLMILKIDSHSSFVPKSDTGDGIVLAFTDMVSRNVIMVVRDRFDNPNYGVANDKNGLTLAIRHELGHVLGVHHILQDKTLMAPKLTLAYDQCIDKTTIEAVAKEQRLNVHDLNYCTYEE